MFFAKLHTVPGEIDKMRLTHVTGKWLNKRGGKRKVSKCQYKKVLKCLIS